MVEGVVETRHVHPIVQFVRRKVNVWPIYLFLVCNKPSLHFVFLSNSAATRSALRSLPQCSHREASNSDSIQGKGTGRALFWKDCNFKNDAFGTSDRCHRLVKASSLTSIGTTPLALRSSLIHFICSILDFVYNFRRWFYTATGMVNAWSQITSHGEYERLYQRVARKSSEFRAGQDTEKQGATHTENETKGKNKHENIKIKTQKNTMQ